MKKMLKYAALFIAALLAIFVALVAYVAIMVNPNDYKPQIVDFVRQETHRTLNLEGSIGLKFFPRLALDLGKASMSGSGGKGEFASIDNAVLDVAWLPLLHGALQIDKISIDGLRIGLVRYKDGTTNYGDLSKGGGKGKTEFDIGGIEVKNSAISYADLKSGSKLALDNIDLEMGRLKPGVHTSFALKMDIDRGGEKSSLNWSTGLLLEQDKYKFDNIDLNYKSGKLAASVKGSADVDTKEETASADLSSNVDASHADAKLAMQGFSSPAYRFDVHVDKLDADKYVSKEKGPSKPFDLSFLKKLNLQGKLAVGMLKVHGLTLSNVAVSAKAADGRLDLDPVAANLYQGKAMGKIVIQAAPKFSVRETLSKISIGPLIKDLANKDIVEGKGNVSVDVAAAGNDVGGLKKTLNGRAAVHLSDGAVKGFDIAAMLRGLKAKAGSANAAEKTDFSELSASFDIRNGIARNSDLSVKSPLLRVGGAGEIDIGRSTMNYLAKVSVVSTLEGQGGANLASLKGLTFPVRISGPFDALHYSLDMGAMASNVLKSKIEQKRNDLLKGLFGR